MEMSFARRERCVPLAAIAAAGLIGVGCAEHPVIGEHEAKRSVGGEHPEHPAGAAAAGITKDSLADAIEAWVKEQ